MQFNVKSYKSPFMPSSTAGLEELKLDGFLEIYGDDKIRRDQGNTV